MKHDLITRINNGDLLIDVSVGCILILVSMIVLPLIHNLQGSTLYRHDTTDQICGCQWEGRLLYGDVCASIFQKQQPTTTIKVSTCE